MPASLVPLWPTALLALAACAGAPPPLSAPTTSLATTYSRTIGDVTPPGPARSLTVETFVLRTALPGAPLDQAIVALAADGDAPFRGASALPAGSVWWCDAGAASWRENLPPATDCLPAATTTAVLSSAFWTRIAGGAAQPTIVARDRDAGVELQFAADDRNGVEVRTILREPLPHDGTGVLFVPAAPGDVAAGIAYVVCDRGTVPAETVAAADAMSRAAPPAPPSALATQRDVALAAIGAHNRRPALLALAQQHQLPRCVDLLLCADEPRLIAMTDRVAKYAPADAADFAWQFERALWQALLPAMQRDELPPGMHSALLRHLGALGDDPTSFEATLAASRDEAAFAAGLRGENLLALDDRSAASRVHAHDWLVVHGGGVPDYDPMAERRERRRALRSFAANPPAATGPTEVR